MTGGSAKRWTMSNQGIDPDHWTSRMATTAAREERLRQALSAAAGYISADAAEGDEQAKQLLPQMLKALADE